MNLYSYITIFVSFIARNHGMEPFQPRPGTLPFLVYFESRHRGLCEGSLISRTAVLTAAVCVLNSTSDEFDTGPINVMTAATYRHPRKGIKIQVTRIILPKLPNNMAQKVNLIQKSAAILLLKRRVPDALVEFPVRGIQVDIKGKEDLGLKEECFTAGWHFFYKHDVVYPINKFLLQRNVRVQFMSVVQKNRWCGALVIKIKNALATFGFSDYYDAESSLCLRDSDRVAQPCHGMYGAPLICRGKVVAMLTAPDAQWTNCTGKSAMFHKINKMQKPFLECVESLFAPEYKVDLDAIRRPEENHDTDYLDDIYDNVFGEIRPIENWSD